MAPVNRVEISSDLLVRMVSQLAQEKRRVPPMWSRKIRPIVKSLGVTGPRLKDEMLNNLLNYCENCFFIVNQKQKSYLLYCPVF